ncbi:SDR family NAD(P)-dependent oxidoreductase [Kitasatospora sp. LaBMicrA B282]|uniref:SDR family NAD(P)-dependent oxidoreductase n=1 Tax=Kitasatospora sp. LaBMicrA B282 TaxID=3420949 RepID=UPI003D12FA07
MNTIATIGGGSAAPGGGRRTVLVTGATSGLGRELAVSLAEQGRHVLVHGRDRARTEALAAELRAAGGEADPLVADLSALAEVRALADRIRAEHAELHVLINNAGIGAGPPPHRTRELSADGHELRLAVNYLAPALLARLLVPLLAASAPARVVNVGSIGQAPVDLRDLRMDHHYGGADAYFRSKFALAAFTVDLAEEVRDLGITVNCLHPATFMDTRQVRETGLAPWVPASAGVAPVLNLAIGPAGGSYSGEYFDGSRRGRAHDAVYDAVGRARLREVTQALLAPFEEGA